jgi:hypothetical protein
MQWCADIALLLHRVGETSLAWTAADRALAAAEQSQEPELVALQAYRLPVAQEGDVLIAPDEAHVRAGRMLPALIRETEAAGGDDREVGQWVPLVMEGRDKAQPVAAMGY